jgi:hypothetical protein
MSKSNPMGRSVVGLSCIVLFELWFASKITPAWTACSVCCRVAVTAVGADDTV